MTDRRQVIQYLRGHGGELDAVADLIQNLDLQLAAALAKIEILEESQAGYSAEVSRLNTTLGLMS